MLRTRALTGVVGGAAFLGVAYLGNPAWAGLWAVLSGVGAVEYGLLLRRAGRRVWLVGLVAFCAWTAWAAHRRGLGGALQPGPLLLLGVAVAVLAVTTRQYNNVESAALTLHGALYLGWLPAHIVALRDAGFPTLLLLFLCIWAADSGAYFAGRAYGHHKLAPAVSPGKTWEGLAGGLALALAVAAVGHRHVPGGWPEALVLAAAAAIAGPAGDLYESAWKRFCEAKDSGALLPGHGGVLDRFDSALWAVPVAHYLLAWLRYGR